MDDDETRRVELPDEPAQPPPPPPPPAVVPPWPPAAVAPPGIDVGELVGRTFDTFGREWSLYLALAIPAGISGFASAALSPPIQAMVRQPGAGSGAEQIPGLVAQLLIAFVSIVASLAMIVATDGYWRGTAVGLSDAVGRAAGALPRAIGLFLVALAIGFAVGIAFVIVALVLAVFGRGALVLLALAVLVLVPVAFYVSARLSVILPVLVLDRTPVVGVIGRTWRLTRGNALALFLSALVIGIASIIPTWGGTLFSLFVDNRVIAGIALALASMVVAPLGAIWTVLAWGRLTGAPYRDSEVMTTGKGRLIGFGLVAGVGMVLVLRRRRARGHRIGGVPAAHGQLRAGFVTPGRSGGEGSVTRPGLRSGGQHAPLPGSTVPASVPRDLATRPGPSSRRSPMTRSTLARLSATVALAGVALAACGGSGLTSPATSSVPSTGVESPAASASAEASMTAESPSASTSAAASPAARTVQVYAVDGGFQNAPIDPTPGTVLTFRNLGTEAHEMIVIRRNDDATDTQTFEDLTKVSPTDLLKFVTVVGVLAADPGQEADGPDRADPDRGLRDRRPARQRHDNCTRQPGSDGDPDGCAERGERHVDHVRGHRARGLVRLDLRGAVRARSGFARAGRLRVRVRELGSPCQWLVRDGGCGCRRPRPRRGSLRLRRSPRSRAGSSVRPTPRETGSPTPRRRRRHWPRRAPRTRRSACRPPPPRSPAARHRVTSSSRGRGSSGR